MGGTRGSSIVSSVYDVVRGMRGVGGVCKMCMRLARSGVGSEWMRGLGLGFTNPVGTGGAWKVHLCLGYVGVGGEWGWAGSGRVMWCYVCVCCEC